MAAPRRLFRPFLRPLAGRKLPPELMPHQVWKLAEALPRGVQDPGYEILLRRIDNSPIYGGNAVALYFDGREAFAAMREAGRAASREILLESYIFRDDVTGRLFLQETADAAARGVTVRVLVDALGSFTTGPEFWIEMEQKKIQFRLFHSLLDEIWYQPFRDHRKILVVDRNVAFTGGMNIGEEYGSPNPRPGLGWRDTHMRVTGPTAWEMAVVFSEGWNHAGGEPFDFEPLPAAAGEAPGARILVLDSRPGRGNYETAAALSSIVGASRQTLWITNAYFAPGPDAATSLTRAASRGVDVRLLLPGWTDVPLLRHAAHGYYEDLLAGGVRIFEYQGAVLHSKTLVADGYLSLIGSTNLDFRSFFFNAECNLVILDHGTAATLESEFRKDLENAVEITAADWQGRTLGHRTLDRFARWLTPVL
jgi:cardiolipin synthase